MLSKCVFIKRRRRRWRRKKRDGDEDVERLRKGVWASGQTDQQVKPWGFNILTHTWGRIAPSMNLQSLTHGSDQTVALSDENGLIRNQHSAPMASNMR